jgi:hypothetical protein
VDRVGQPVGVVVHNFQQQLADSHTLSDEPSWLAFYEHVWPKQILCAVRIDKDSVFQRWGIDREIKLSTGQAFTIDEKKRLGPRDYGDMLIEEVSVWHGHHDPRNKAGWALDLSKRCDYLAYAVTATQTCTLIPFDLLRRTARLCLPEWRRVASKYPLFAENRGYKTLNCPVTWERLWTDMRRVSVQEFRGTITLPTPFVVQDQIVFNFGVKEPHAV